MEKGDHTRADTFIAECRSIAEREGDVGMLLAALNSAAKNACEKGDLDRARAEFLALREKAGEVGDRGMVAVTTINLADVASRAGDFQRALDYAATAVDFFSEVGDDGGVAVSVEACGWNALALSNPARAEQAFRDALVIFGRVGSIRHTAISALGLGAALVTGHKEERGVRLLAAAAALRSEFGVGFGDEAAEQAHDRAFADAKASLGEEAFAEAWARGETMAPADIVTFAQAEATTDVGTQEARSGSSR